MPWAEVPLSEVGALIRGRGGSKADAVDNGVPCIRYGDLYTRHDNVVRDVQSFVAASRASAYTALQFGDVVFAASGETVDEIGKAAAFCGTQPAVTSGDTIVLRPGQRADGRFLGYAANSISANKHKSRMGQGSSVFHISASHIGRYRLPLPPLPEQRAIAAVLDTIDDAIQKTEQIIAKLQQVKQGLLHDLLTRGIDDNGELRDPERHPQQFQDSPLGRIPKGWTVQLVDEVAVRGSGHTPSKRVPSYWNGGIKWVSLADSWRLDRTYIFDTDKEISELGIANSSAVKHTAGTVVVSRDAGVGKSAILGVGMAVSQHFIAWRCSDRLSELFFYYWLQHKKPMFEAIAFGSTIQTIGLPFFKRLRMAVPPRDEQDAAAARIRAIENAVDQETMEAEKLRALKAGLAEDLLTGRVRTTSLVEVAA